MPRSMRTLIAVAVIALLGVVALAWMARRYAALIPPASPLAPAPAAAAPPAQRS